MTTTEIKTTPAKITTGIYHAAWWGDCVMGGGWTKKEAMKEARGALNRMAWERECEDSERVQEGCEPDFDAEAYVAEFEEKCSTIQYLLTLDAEGVWRDNENGRGRSYEGSDPDAYFWVS